jgi:uncharacterized membrane protein
MRAHDHADEAHTLHRMVFFSVAVFAIILTLLALELRAPENIDPDRLFDAVRHMGRPFFAFVMSFAVIGVFWMAHLSTFRKAVVFDWWTAIVNLGLLFTIALIPFCSSLVGEHGQYGQAWAVYCAVMVAASIAEVALVLVLMRDQGRLLGGLSSAERHHRLMRAASPGLIFGIGLALDMSGHEGLAAFCWVLFFPVLLSARLLFVWRSRRGSSAA